MTDPSRSNHRAQVVAEEAANREYIRLLVGGNSKPTSIAVPRSAKWTGTALPAPQDVPVGPVIGRVALDVVDPDIGRADFYIGPWHKEADTLVVFSWAAPVARTFFDPVGDAYELCHRVLVTRTMSLRGEEIVDYVDDAARPDGIGDAFAAQRPLQVPQAPQSQRNAPTEVGSSSTLETASPIQADGEALQPSREAPTIADSLEPPNPARAVAAPRAVKGTSGPPALRAKAAVLAAITSPRADRLTSTLATLQPDQYDVVTRPSWLPMIVQGNPGTGKTIIAAHRAAYLVHRERGPSRMGKVLLVGPTEQYRDHVRGIVDELAEPGAVRVEGLGAMLEGLRHLRTRVSGPMDGHYLDCDSEIEGMADFAADRLFSLRSGFSKQPPEQRVRLIYECLRANHAHDEQIAYDPDLIHRLKGLPSFEIAGRQRSYIPILAMCAISGGAWQSLGYDHIIVDEAQDVRPLEWRILNRLNEGGGWSILGDVFQRRSDYSYRDWGQVAAELDLAVDGKMIEPLQCRRGYRSTRPIMKFANQLLPAEGRRSDSLQTDGPPVTVKRAPAAKLGFEAAQLAVSLCGRYPSGTVAIITPDLAAIEGVLPLNGWTREPGAPRWTKGDLRMAVLGSENSRGVEFDGVVVVEPAAFPANLGIRGQLYTSLTRANRELVVVHSRGLPEKMRVA